MQGFHMEPFRKWQPGRRLSVCVFGYVTHTACMVSIPLSLFRSEFKTEEMGSAVIINYFFL